MHVQIPNLKKDAVEPIIVQATLYVPSRPKVTRKSQINEIIEVKQEVVPEIEEYVVSNKKNHSIEIEEIKKQSEIINTPSDISQKPIKETDIPMLETPLETLVEGQPASIKSIFATNANKHIRQHDQMKLNNLAQQVSKEYRYNKFHPEIKAATKKILSHDEQLQKSVERKVDCKTMTGKMLNILSGLGHGTGIGNGPVKCGKYNGLKPFIEKRMTKSAPLPQ